MPWSVGDASVARVPELLPVLPAWNLLAQATPEALAPYREWLVPHFMDEQNTLRMSVHSFVVRSEGLTILVDTCVGNDKPRAMPGMGSLRTPYLETLALAGCRPETVDAVLCTHLHLDHVGWNTVLVDGRWDPTFPNARYLIGRTEWEHWRSQVEQGVEVLDCRAVLADSVQPVLDAGLVDLVETDHRLTGEVFLEPTPGHTPGHVSVRIASAGADAVITGDMFHHPVQIAETSWGVGADGDPELAATTRKRFVERFADSPSLVLGTHFHPPTGGRIVSGPSGHRFEVATAR